MDTQINKVIEQTAKSIHLKSIVIQEINNSLRISVYWNWRDINGNIIKSSITHYTEEQINEILLSKGTSTEAFKRLFLTIVAEEAIK